VYVEMRADLLGYSADLELLGRCVQPLADAGHTVSIHIEVGPGATFEQIATLQAWLEPVKGAVWTVQTRRSARPGLGSGLVYDLAVNIGSELLVDAMLLPILLKVTGVLKHFRRTQSLPPDTSVLLTCDTDPKPGDDAAALADSGAGGSDGAADPERGEG
jgi:hypothetical protein